MNVRAHVRANFPMHGFDLAVLRDNAGATEAWHPSGEWLPFDTTVIHLDGTPWITFPGTVADAVVEAVERHTRSTEGYVPADARRDYLAERERVDRLTAALVGVAERMTGRR